MPVPTRNGKDNYDIGEWPKNSSFVQGSNASSMKKLTGNTSQFVSTQQLIPAEEANGDITDVLNYS